MRRQRCPLTRQGPFRRLLALQGEAGPSSPGLWRTAVTALGKAEEGGGPGERLWFLDNGEPATTLFHQVPPP